MPADADLCTPSVVITCEHGGDRVPARYAALLAAGRRRLPVHRWYDPGALELARRFAGELDAPLVFATVTRLLVDLNRSPGKRSLFSSFTGPLDDATKRTILERYYQPYRQRVETLLTEAVSRAGHVVQLSVHSFSPLFRGRYRRTDVGLLYDPSSRCERRICRAWQAALHRLRPDLSIRRNHPYRGTADGLTTYLRGRFDRTRYAGIELEVSQRWYRGNKHAWRRLQHDLIETFSLAQWLSVSGSEDR
jgi:predicted N-formylglutamate amidohydrolase